MIKKILNNTDINTRLGNNIKIKRKILGLSQSDLAQDIDVSCQQLHKYESGKSSLNIKVLQSICDSMHVDMAKIIYELQTKDANADEAENMTEQAIYDKSLTEKIAHSFPFIDDPELKKKFTDLIGAVVLASKETQHENS